MTLRHIALGFTALLPGFLKRPVFKYVFGYKIGANVRIGMAYLDCRSLTIGDGARIGHGVVFLGCGSVAIGEHAQLGFLNFFRGGSVIRLAEYASILRLNVFNAIPCNEQDLSQLDIGCGSVITAEHRIDFTDSVRIGRNSILGGRNSSLWTHIRRAGVPVVIGDFCYIGSEVRLGPGSSIPNCCILGMGSVVIKPFQEEFSLYAGVPARKVRNLDSEDYELIFAKTRTDLPNQELPKVPAAAAQGQGRQSW